MNVAPTLRVLGLTMCGGVTNKTFAPPTLAYLRELTLVDRMSGVITADALVGLASLEVFHSRGNYHAETQEAMEVLGSLKRLKRLLLWARPVGLPRVREGFRALRDCPLIEIDLSGPLRCYQTVASEEILQLPVPLQTFRFSGTVIGVAPWHSPSLAGIVVRKLERETFAFPPHCRLYISPRPFRRSTSQGAQTSSAPDASRHSQSCGHSG